MCGRDVDCVWREILGIVREELVVWLLRIVVRRDIRGVEAGEGCRVDVRTSSREENGIEGGSVGGNGYAG